MDNSIHLHNIPMTPIALFDFDGTLTRHDTFISFSKFALGKFKFIRGMALTFPWLIMWRLGIISNSSAKEILFSRLFKGMSLLQFRELGEKFAPLIERDLRYSTVEILNKHKASGHRLYIVSASLSDWIKPWAKHKGIDGVIATEVETDSDGCLTGRFHTPNCHGKEKVARIIAEIPDAVPENMYAYGDSNGDDAMLDFAAHSKKISTDSIRKRIVRIFATLFHTSSRKAEIMRFAIVGIIAVIIQYSVFLLLVSHYGMPTVTSTVISYTVSLICNFILSNLFTFHTKPNIRKAILFTASHILNFSLQLILVSVFSMLTGPELALLPVLAICGSVNYIFVRMALTHR